MLISTQGDVGDLIFLLNLIRQIPNGPHTLCLRPGGGTKYRTPGDLQKLYDLIAPLALKQPYIAEVKIIGPEDKVDWASERFREKFYTPGETLMQAHLNNLIKIHGIGKDFTSRDPWLFNVEPSPRSRGRVVINRTNRYRNPFFMWSDVVDHYRHRLLFVGLHHEWREFVGTFGYVDFQPTSNMLEVSELISGSELFIGNQSCANAVNEGLKHRSIQETDLNIPDCIFGRENGVFCAKGDCELPDIDGSGSRKMKFVTNVAQINLSTMPPGGWQYPGMPSQQHIDAAVTMLWRNQRETFETHEHARVAILQFNADRTPEFFQNVDTGASRYRLAMQSAGF